MQTQRVRSPWVTWLVGLGVMLTLAACSVPSLHGVHSSDVSVDDPGLAGLWSDDGGDLIAKIDRTGYGTMTVDLAISDDQHRSHNLALDAWLVQLGDARFADLVPGKAQREALVHEHQALAIRMHQLVKVERKGDVLKIWEVDEKELRRRIDAGEITLDHAELDASEGGPTWVLTAPTPVLQRVLTEHGKDGGLFESPNVLHRMVRP